MRIVAAVGGAEQRVAAGEGGQRERGGGSVIRVSRGGYVLLTALAVAAASGVAPSVAAAMPGVPMWGLVAGAVVPLIAHEAAHLAAARLIGLRPRGLVLTGTSIGAIVEPQPGLVVRARQQIVVSVAGPASSLPVGLIVLGTVSSPAIRWMAMCSCAGSALQIIRRPGSDGDRLASALKTLNASMSGAPS